MGVLGGSYGTVECVRGLGTAGICGVCPADGGSPSRIDTHGEVPRITGVFDDSLVRLYCQERVFRPD